jgi:hypothetical protein
MAMSKIEWDICRHVQFTRMARATLATAETTLSDQSQAAKLEQGEPFEIPCKILVY